MITLTVPSSGTQLTSVVRQSMNVACASLLISDAIWSSNPQRTPTKSCSAFCASRAICIGSSFAPNSLLRKKHCGVLQRSAAAQARAEREIPCDLCLEALDWQIVAAKLIDHAKDVARPRRDVLGEELVDRDALGLAQFPRVNLDPPVAALLAGDGRAAIDRQREHEALIVVGVVAQQFGATGSVGGDRGHQADLIAATIRSVANLLAAGGFQPTNRCTSNVALWPPKPKELLMAVSTRHSRALWGT